MSTEDAEYKKLYTLLTSLSSKTAPRTNQVITPMISLENEEKTSRILTLDVPPLEKLVHQSNPPTPKVEKRPISPREFPCDACFRTFPTYSQLQTHLKITPMCASWETLPNKEEYYHNPPSIHIYMDELLAETVATEGKPTECRFCHNSFSNKGNLHKHFHTSIVCNRMAYARFKKVVANLK